MATTLREGFGVRRSEAWKLAGVNDLTNLRRQIRRAVARSPAARRIVGVVMVLALPFLPGCGGGASADAASAAPSAELRGDAAIALPVVGAVARRGDLVLTVRATGVVRAERLVAIRPEAQGSVAEVLVRPGEQVAAGQVLVRLDPRPFDLAVREAEAALGSALMQYHEAMLGTPDTDTSEAARTRRENARLRSGMVAAEVRLDRARLDREHVTIAAPFPGVLDEVGVVAGQRIGPSDLVARVVDLGTLLIEAAVLEHDLPLMRAGASAIVRSSAGRDTQLRGSVIAVLPLVDTTTRAGRVLVRVRADGRLRPGMYADVELEATRLRDRIIVPAAAIIERDGRPLVFRARGGKAEWVYLTPGRSNGVETEVAADSATSIQPLAPGDTVLVAGHLTLTHDARVQVQPRP
jgi:membrane fusion protein, multidrug efflux system